MNTSNITNYKPKEFFELLNVSIKTLQRWDREKILVANRTPTYKLPLIEAGVVDAGCMDCVNTKSR